MSNPNNYLTPNLRLIAWEITKKCNLTCAHCRASSEDIDYNDELSTEECFNVIDNILKTGKPIIILTGGEPLYRADIVEIGKYATAHGLRIVLGTNGTLLTSNMVSKLKEIPISRVGVSIDFPTSELQDRFRGTPGAFADAISGIEQAQRAGLEIQINSTITKMNAQYLDELLNLAIELGAVAFHPFMLVPTGRGKNLADVELPAEEYERILNWIFDRQMELGDRIFFKPTDAPHYMRIMLQRNKEKSDSPVVESAMNRMTRGCLAGTGFCFISNIGRVQGCGYLDVEAGNVRSQDFATIWQDSPLFQKLRDLSNIKGKCGDCIYKRVCGGCRARAYEATGDYLQSEPYCTYQPVCETSRASASTGIWGCPPV